MSAAWSTGYSSSPAPTVVRAAAFDLYWVMRSSQPHGGDAGQQPGELGVRGDVGLEEQGRAGRIDTAGEQQRRELAPRGAQRLDSDRLGDRESVEIDDTKDVVVARLVRRPHAQRADVVAEVEPPGRLDP